MLRPRLVERRACVACLDGGAAVEAIALSCAGQPATLLVERRIALGLVNAVLQLPPSVFAGPLSRIERGVLEGTIATILARLGQTGALGLRGGAGDGLPSGSCAIAVSVGLNDETGCAWLVASDASLERLWTMRNAGGEEGLPWLEVARTRVPEREMASAEVGDVLVFDETPALSPATVWPARILWRGRDLPVLWSEDGLLSGIEGTGGLEDVTWPERKPIARKDNAAGASETPWVDVSAGSDCESTRRDGRGHLAVSRANRICVKVSGGSFGWGAVVQHNGAFAVVLTHKTID